MREAAWDAQYPDAAALRREVEAMTSAFFEAIFATIPRHEIEGVYLKGSTRKVWHSPLDYVPELSDIDIHLIFTGDDAITRCLGSVEEGLSISALAERKYRDAITSPLHVPRVQLTILNTLHHQPDYLPSPTETVTVAFGRPQEEVEIDPARVRDIACSHLLESEPYLAALGLQAVDALGWDLWRVLRGMIWRISPTGPRVLELRGVPFHDAWCINRTMIAERLHELGEEQLTTEYAAFYLHAWEYFLSGYRDGAAGRASVLAGARVLAWGTSIARFHLEDAAS